jgi:hypothetical protein
MSFQFFEDDDLCYLETNETMCQIHETNTLLRRRNDVLATLCRVETHAYIVQSAVVIQAHVRGWMLRYDKTQFDRCITNALKHARMALGRRRFQKARQSATRIQSYIRGRKCRKSGLAYAVQKIHEYKQNVTDLELLVLRLTSLAFAGSADASTTTARSFAGSADASTTTARSFAGSHDARPLL